MYHSITFGEKNTWDDWHLIPTSRPVINLPEIKQTLIDIPGGYGSIDISENLAGHILYDNRKGTLEFYIDHDYWNSWVDTFHEISSYIHGQVMQLILEDDPGYYYEGRLTVSSWSSEENFSKIGIDYDLYPFKKELVYRDQEWLWDPFDFEKGIIYTDMYHQHSFSSTYSLTIDGTDEYIIPIIWMSGLITPKPTVTVSYNGITKTLEEGKANIFPEFSIGKGNHRFLFNSTGSAGGLCEVTIVYQGGLL